jgi:hypothetical protein
MEAVRDLQKASSFSGAAQEEFANIQVRLGFQKKLNLQILDVENRWNSMFDLVDSCYQLNDMFEAICNLE